VGFAFAAEVGVAADSGSSALAFPVDDPAGISLLLAHLDGLADGGLELGVVGDLLSTGVGVVEQDDGSGSFGDALKGVDELSDGPCVLGLALPDCGMEGVDEEDGFAFVLDEEVLDLFLSGRSVDGVAAEAEVERGGLIDVGVAVESGKDFAGGVVEAEEPSGGLFHRESAEGPSLGDGFGERDGDGGLSDFGRSGEEDEAVLTEEALVSVGS
jgi:hypothetical protein